MNRHLSSLLVATVTALLPGPAPADCSAGRHPVLWFSESEVSSLRQSQTKGSFRGKLAQIVENDLQPILVAPRKVPIQGAITHPDVYPGGVKVVPVASDRWYSTILDRFYSGTTVTRGQGSVILENYPFKQAFYWQDHQLLSYSVKYAAFLYMLTGSREHLAYVANILSEYGRNFAAGRYPLHEPDGSIFEPDPLHPFAGRIVPTALDESFFFYNILVAFDWTVGSGAYSHEQCAEIQALLGAEHAAIMRELDSATYWDNHTAAENLARSAYGIFKGDMQLTQAAMSGKHGISDHLDRAMNSDGRTESYGIGYHYSFMKYLLLTAELLTRSGQTDAFESERERLMAGIDFILNSSYLDGVSIPQVQTSAASWKWTPNFSLIFEIGLNRFREPRYQLPLRSQLEFLPADELRSLRSHWGPGALRGSFQATGGGGSYVEAFFTGVPALPKRLGRVSLPSVHMEKSRYIFLRKGGPTDGLGVFFTYDDYKAHHSDLMSFQLFGRGRELGVESGMPIQYSLPEYGGFYSQRVAHNAVVVDQHSPGLPANYGPVGPALKSIGTAQVTEFSDDGRKAVATLKADGTLYTGLDISRRLTLTRDSLLVEDDLAGTNGEHVFDWPFRAPGAISAIRGVALTAWDGELGDDYGYRKEYLFNIKRGFTDRTVTIRWSLKRDPVTKKRLRLQLRVKGTPNTEIILADQYLEQRSGPYPMILIRRKGGAAAFSVQLKPLSPRRAHMHRKHGGGAP